jgi:O-antigen ligase
MTSASTLPHAIVGPNEDSMLSACIAFFIPALLGLYWVIYSRAPDAAIALLRPSVFGATILLAVLWSRKPATQAEVSLAKVLLLLCAVLIVPCLTSTQPSRAFADWSKLTVLCILCLLWCRALRNQANAKMFGLSLIFAACTLAALTLATYVVYMGFVLPTYKSAREFKGITEKTISFNAVAFAAVLAYLSAMCLLRKNKFLLALGVVLFVVSTVFTGSRAPAAIVLLGGIITLATRTVRSPKLSIRFLSWLAIAAFVVAAVAAVTLLSSRQITKITEGRWDLWSVARQKILERPLLGYGYESWRDDLVSRLPGEYALTMGIAKNIAGGYHNEYLTMLAEQGLIGTLAVLYFFWFLLRSCWQLAYRSSNTWRHGPWALFACLVIMLRAGVEMPGLFGYSQEPVDYFAYLFAAIVISRFSVEEDYLRASSSAVKPVGNRVKELAPSGFRSSVKGIANLS